MGPSGGETDLDKVTCTKILSGIFLLISFLSLKSNLREGANFVPLGNLMPDKIDPKSHAQSQDIFTSTHENPII